MAGDVQLYDATMGRSVKGGATDTCSKCGHTIPEEHVPLICWDKTGNIMWVYCDQCDGSIFRLLYQPKEAP